MKVLVSGGSGFLGSHVADALAEKGHQVTLFDRTPSKYISDGQKEIIGNILDKELLIDIVRSQDIVYHFAGIADIEDCLLSPSNTAMVNIVGTINLLEACRLSKVERFVFASTAYVYSDAGFFYRTSKQACEQFIEDFHKLYGLEFTCIRYGSLYGERADLRNSIYSLLKQALSNGKIIYHGTGDEIREFIHVKDAAEMSVGILSPEYANENITITGVEKYKYSELLSMVKEILGNQIEIEYLPSDREAHYKITPYNFTPKLGKKVTNNKYIDMGQGLLFCMMEVYEQLGMGNYEIGFGKKTQSDISSQIYV